jgi:hypothetical protein
MSTLLILETLVETARDRLDTEVPESADATSPTIPDAEDAEE